MSDLISREAVKKAIQQYFIAKIENHVYEIDVVDCNAGICHEAIDNIPTAYDVDKVIEQLEDYGKHKGLLRITDNPANCDNYVPVREVKKIVKGAVKDE